MFLDFKLAYGYNYVGRDFTYLKIKNGGGYYEDY